MLPAIFLSLAVVPSFDPTCPKKYPPVYVPVEAPFGYLYQPAYDLTIEPRLPSIPYSPRPGDILLLSDTNVMWSFLYRLAFTGRPGHAGVVVTMTDGRLGVLEAGYNDTTWTRVTPLDYRINEYHGTVWIRQREVPITPEQDRKLTDFATVADGGRYALGRFILQITPIRSRGPLRTYVMGEPRGIGGRYFCAEETLEALAYAGLIDAHAARPAATFPQDMFYDRSRNLYVDHHPPLINDWRPPSLWTALDGSTLTGKSRPHPPSPWPGVGAYAVYPVTAPGEQVPTPVVVRYVPGELSPVADLQQHPKRIGFFDRPTGLFRRN
jgi:hypothetical protein